MKTALVSLALSATLVAACGAAAAADLEIEVRGVTQPEGQVLAAAYGTPAEWLKGKPVAVARELASTAADGKLILRMTGLPDGATVGVSVFHDLNSNGRLDVNAMGMPQEPFGFSQDAVGSYGPPKFEQAAVTLQGAVTRITVQLN